MKIFIASLLLICANNLYAQEGELFDKIKAEFINFEYKNLIRDADDFLKTSTEQDSATVVEVYRMKAIAHFSLMQDNQAENTFRKILDLDTAFALDPYQNSPKIIQFFNDIKAGYMAGLQKIEEEKKLMKPDTVYITKEVIQPNHQQGEKEKVIRSLILPGWGHLYSGEKGKGWLLTSLGGVSFLSSLYFSIDAAGKEKLYNTETNLARINVRYNEYNKSYKYRNISLITFAAVWIYSQLDILLFNADMTYQENALTLKFSF